jgi:hypothetical protein
MSKKFELRPIEDSVENAIFIQRIVRDDLLRLPGIAASDALTMANPDEPEHVKEQLARLRQSSHGPIHYRSFHQIDNAEWLGVVKTGEWLYGDQAPFEGPVVNAGRKALHRVGLHRPKAGIHVFSVDRPDSELYDGMLSETVDMLREESGSAVVNTAADLEDELYLEALKERNFRALQVGAIAIRGVKRDYQLHEADLH